ncbi:hypothetical protein KK137_07655 [Croceibacterium sp. LX-88]|uniref:Transposase n=1 Tax=Croceibacterium selenioxidans TaxID=2838833 RepID=A0ABS5W367_9SPHN|nr:hypothetical protein [Croceibacterium selenioxidans]MBT2134201.1 hypothetical protein [Croceibacterium selenioxidans]
MNLGLRRVLNQGFRKEPWTARYDLSVAERRLIETRGVARVDDRRVINGIFYWLRQAGSQGPRRTLARFGTSPGVRAPAAAAQRE